MDCCKHVIKGIAKTRTPTESNSEKLVFPGLVITKTQTHQWFLLVKPGNTNGWWFRLLVKHRNTNGNTNGWFFLGFSNSHVINDDQINSLKIILFLSFATKLASEKSVIQSLDCAFTLFCDIIPII
jgi:hypothetical protein